MSVKQEVKEYLYIIPIVCATFIGVSFFTPTASAAVPMVGAMVWMCGLTWAKVTYFNPFGGDSSVEKLQFTPDPGILAISLVCMVILICVMGAFIAYAYWLRSGKAPIKRGMLYFGFMTLAMGVIYIIGIEAVTEGSFWGNYTMGFGVIGPLIAATVGIVAGLVREFYLLPENE
jgi:hypothetical protein